MCRALIIANSTLHTASTTYTYHLDQVVQQAHPEQLLHREAHEMRGVPLPTLFQVHQHQHWLIQPLHQYTSTG